MNRDVNILVDCRRDQESSVPSIIRRQISPAAAERDSQWRTRNDHSENANMEIAAWLVQPSHSLVNGERFCPETDSILPGLPPEHSYRLQRARRASSMS